MSRVDQNNQRKVQTPMFSNDSSKKDRYMKLSQSNKATNIVEMNNKIKDKKQIQDEYILNNILNADNFRYKSNLLNGETYKSEIGKYFNHFT